MQTLLSLLDSSTLEDLSKIEYSLLIAGITLVGSTLVYSLLFNELQIVQITTFTVVAFLISYLFW